MMLYDLFEMSKKIEDDFLFGDCASFAVALQDVIGGELYALVRNGKALHIFVNKAGKKYDVKGERSTTSMVLSLVGGLEAGWKVEGPFTIDNQPCKKVSNKKIEIAKSYIVSNKHKFKV